MQTLIIPSQTATPRIMSCRPPQLYVAGQRRRDLQVASWDVQPAPTFGHVRLVSLWANNTGSSTDCLADLPAIGTSVRIIGATGGEFPGIVAAHSIEMDEQGEHLFAEIKHELAALLEVTIDSRWQLDADSQTSTARSTVHFNVNTRRSTWASESVSAIAGRPCRWFDSSPTARRWTVADALGYLLAAHAPAGVQTPGLQELDALAGQIDLGSFNATGKSLAEALADVAHRGGLELRAAEHGLGLVFYRPGSQGRQRTVRIQPQGASLSPTATNLWRCRIKTSRRPSRRGVLALGDRKLYEATFTLKRGWDPSLETSTWRDFVRSMSPHWNKLADVYRKWVVNEHDWYNQSPWNLPSGDLSWVDPDDFYLKTPRRFLNCLSCNPAGKSMGIVVEYRISGSEDWNIWGGPVQVAPDECAIYLGGDTLPGEFFHAAADDKVEVRVTAAVAADACVMASVPGDANYPWRIVDCQSLAAWQKVHSSSVLKDAQGLGQPAERDDSLTLQRIANRHAQIEARATVAELILGWTDTSFHVGDIVARIDGRGMELSSSALGCPAVTAVQHNFANQTTTLVVSG